jgi:hypothetical protein
MPFCNTLFDKSTQLEYRIMRASFKDLIRIVPILTMRIRLHQLVALTIPALSALPIKAQSSDAFNADLPHAIQMREPVAASVSGQTDAFYLLIFHR